MAFPLAERELTRGGRHWRTYALRVAATGVPCIVLIYSLPLALAGADAAEVGENVSRALSGLCKLFQYAIAFIVTPMMCAGAIAQEKQERTLGLLMMADFRGWDVYAAKFASAFMQNALLLASTLPLIAIAAILGGISVPAAAAVFTLLMVATMTVCALGLLASILARKPSEALYVTFFFIAIWLIGSTCIDFYAGNGDPRVNIAFSGMDNDRFLESPMNWLPGIGVAAVISISAMGVSLYLLPKQVYAKVGTTKRTSRFFLDRIVTRRILRLRPATALIQALLSDQRTGAGSAILRAALPVTMLLMGCVPGAGLIIVFSALCYDLSTGIAHLRRNQAYDDLLVADISVESIARSTWRALLVHSWPYFCGFAAQAAILIIFFGAINAAAAGSFVPGLIALGFIVLAAAFGSYGFAVAISCAVAVLRWGAVGQTIAGLFIFGWIQMFFFIGTLVFTSSLFGIASNTGSALFLPPIAFAAACAMWMAYFLLTMMFRKGFEHDFSYTLRNPDRTMVAS